MSGGRNALLDTGSLVHESYLRFATSGSLKIEDRVHFLRWAGRVMRSVIVDFARRRTATRRGGGAARVALTAEIADGRGTARRKSSPSMKRSTTSPRSIPGWSRSSNCAISAA